jgi:hypothetical protein
VDLLFDRGDVPARLGEARVPQRHPHVAENAEGHEREQHRFDFDEQRQRERHRDQQIEQNMQRRFSWPGGTLDMLATVAEPVSKTRQQPGR